MRRLLALTTAVALLVPLTALGQSDPDAPIISIEDMLLQQALNGEIPINARMAERIRELQEENARLAHEAQQQAATASSEEDTTLHTAAPDEPTSGDETVTLDADGQTITLSASDIRLLARLRSRGISSTSLHAGAPLAPTGPATGLMVLALAVAVGLTFLRAWMVERKNRN